MISRGRKLWSILSCLTIIGLLVASCAPATAPTPTKTAPTAITQAPPPAAPTPTKVAATPAAEEPRRGGILTVTHQTEPPGFDLHRQTSLSMEALVASSYNGLVRVGYSDVTKLEGDLAEKWEVTPDGLTYTFHLRQGVKWHDGKPFTAEDARFSMERIYNPQKGEVSPRQEQVAAITAVDAPDASTLRLRLSRPSPSLILNLSSPFFSVVPKHVVQEKGNMNKDVVGTGPYKFKSYMPGIAYEVVANKDYFLKEFPYLDGITWYIIKDRATLMSAFRTQRVLLWARGSYGPSVFEAKTLKEKMPGAIVFKHPPLNWEPFFMNSQRPPWNDVRVRRAVSLAVDRQLANRVVEDNEGWIGAAMPPYGQWGLTEEQLRNEPGYRQPKDADIAEAKRLLAEAGYPKGFETTMTIRSPHASTEKMAVFMEQQLAAIGIKSTIKALEHAVETQALTRGDFDTSPHGLAEAMDDPDTILSIQYHSKGGRNYSHYSDPELDKLLEKQSSILDPAERKKAVIDAQRRILDQAPVVMVYWKTYWVAHWPEVKNLSQMVGPYLNANYERVWIARR